MNKLFKKFRVFKDTGKWKLPDYSDTQNMFMIDINKIAKKHGYKQILFAENNNSDRLVQFTRIKNE